MPVLFCLIRFKFVIEEETIWQSVVALLLGIRA
jgi:hypothetical protein